MCHHHQPIPSWHALSREKSSPERVQELESQLSSVICHEIRTSLCFGLTSGEKQLANNLAAQGYFQCACQRCSRVAASQTQPAHGQGCRSRGRIQTEPQGVRGKQCFQPDPFLFSAPPLKDAAVLVSGSWDPGNSSNFNREEGPPKSTLLCQV